MRPLPRRSLSQRRCGPEDAQRWAAPGFVRSEAPSRPQELAWFCSGICSSPVVSPQRTTKQQQRFQPPLAK
ncbi:unnamed protein product [Rangifer tarandus platyrhynchus]|uniref:Uncharacterized protein n=2 Tax=Rangifer tarandus platyrhynchus TaxID=3082113 RepID=A0ABN8Z7H1_RANTA|nr:unnamed protein product [Rangifer tarandus platyrhynchus]CAI9704078.1 unnamed protein product [Rangifer tarandus platyrhynchus]